MSDTPRRWFQIHLSTATVLMFVSGALIWINVSPREDRVRSQSYLSYGQWQVTIKGLPFVFLTEKNSSTINGAAKSTASEEVMLQGLQSFGLKDRKLENGHIIYTDRSGAEFEFKPVSQGYVEFLNLHYSSFEWRCLVYDILIAFAIIAVIAVAIELMIRRRVSMR
jgi:hypothetical protein